MCRCRAISRRGDVERERDRESWRRGKKERDGEKSESEIERGRVREGGRESEQV